jgi:hypothetical protein
MCCLHSTLHPVGAARTPIQDHRETVFVIAKKERCRLVDVWHTIHELPVDTT